MQVQKFLAVPTQVLQFGALACNEEEAGRHVLIARRGWHDDLDDLEKLEEFALAKLEVDEQGA
ncbi:MAG TPA: hypothetical protein VFG22_06335 [Polyangiales bacterium]|nr:hypothetical protein [Polyangiales bacterium]